MELHGWIAIAILAAAAVLFLTRWLPVAVTAMAIPLALFLTGTVPDAEIVLEGFGNQAVLALAAVFILSDALGTSGVADLIARRLQSAGGGETRLLLVIGLVIAAMSAFMSNAATVAVMLPAMLAISQRSGVPISRLAMPMGFAAVLGGNLTLIGTAPNLLLSDSLKAETGAGFGMFDFSIVGLPIVVVGVTLMAVLGRRLLPRGDDSERLARAHLPQQIVKHYGVGHTLTRLRIGQASLLAGHTLVELKLQQRYGITVALVGRHAGLGLHWKVPQGDLELAVGDDLYLEGEDVDVWRLAEEQQTRMGLPGEHQFERVLDQGVQIAEAMVGPRSAAIGSSLRELSFRRRFKLSVLALWRGGRRSTDSLSTSALAVGDTLLVAGSAGAVRRLSESDDFELLTPAQRERDVRRAPLTLALFAVAIVPQLFGWIPLSISAMLAALLLVVTRCVPVRHVGRSIDWTVLALVVGTMPLGHALEVHGVADLAAELLTSSTSEFGPAAVLAVLYATAALTSVTSSNAAAAVILAPVALAAAEDLAIDPSHALLAVAYGCSCAFIVPFAQCNLMVTTPGGYRARDFIKVGGLLTLFVGSVTIALLSLLVR